MEVLRKIGAQKEHYTYNQKTTVGHTVMYVGLGNYVQPIKCKVE